MRLAIGRRENVSSASCVCDAPVVFVSEGSPRQDWDLMILRLTPRHAMPC